jgi:hypothetical protein
MARKKTGTKTGQPGTFATGPDPRRGVGKPGRSGRPKSEVRDACRAGFDEAIPVLLAIARGELPEVSNTDRIRAADVLGKYGGMIFTETEAKIEDRGPAAKVVLYMPDNGRTQRAAPLGPLPRIENGRARRPVTGGERRPVTGAGPGGVERRNWATREPDEPDE